jgi:hypothetical protein
MFFDEEAVSSQPEREGVAECREKEGYATA